MPSLVPSGMEQPDKPASPVRVEQEWEERREQAEDVGGNYQYMNQFSDQDFQTTGTTLCAYR